tara:strand:- start:146 stop:697 length:552 start_codon:yes stop_codon:yes gene_type:complete
MSQITTGIDNFKIEKTEEEVYYFFYKSQPNQIIEISGICDDCNECVYDYVKKLDGLEKCPNCKSELWTSSKCAFEFFETDEDDDAIAGFAYRDFSESELDHYKVGTMTIQGLINVDKEIVRVVEYDNDDKGTLGLEEPFENYGIKYFSKDIYDALPRISLFTDEWRIHWEQSIIYNNKLEKIN